MKFPKELQVKRTKCIVYTRVMGYLRPVESFNIGKVGEHKERVLFKEKKTITALSRRDKRKRTAESTCDSRQ